MGELLADTQFAGYRIKGREGRGGMGVVYRATDLALDRTVALKVLAEELAQDESFRRRFVTESKLAASLDHPNVIPIYAAGEHDGVLYIVMRFVAGRDLRSLLRSEGRLRPSRAAWVVAQVASALDAAHAAGLVHRDVKPANILLAPSDHVYLTDFGLSKRLAANTAITSAGEFLGTLDYLAPEQIRREPVGPYTDIYALACVAYELLTGTVPFPGDSEEGRLWAHLAEPPPKAGATAPELGTAFDAALRRAMSKRPEDRPPSAGEFADAIVAAAGLQGPELAETRTRAPARAPGRPVASRRPGERREILVAAATERFNVIVLAVLVVAAFVLGPLMVALALAVYLVAVALSYRDPATRRRVADRHVPYRRTGHA